MTRHHREPRRHTNWWIHAETAPTSSSKRRAAPEHGTLTHARTFPRERPPATTPASYGSRFPLPAADRRVKEVRRWYATCEGTCALTSCESPRLRCAAPSDVARKRFARGREQGLRIRLPADHTRRPFTLVVSRESRRARLLAGRAKASKELAQNDRSTPWACFVSTRERQAVHLAPASTSLFHVKHGCRQAERYAPDP